MSDYLRSNSQHIFGVKFADQLCTAFVSSNENRRTFILGTVTLIATASVQIGRILWVDRFATLGGGAGSESVAACGLFADAGGGQRCFHCDAVVAAADPERCWETHKAVSPACFLAKLGLLVLNNPSAPDAAELQLDARRYQPVLRRLRQVLDSSVVAAAAAYGFDVLFLRMCAGRHFMRNGCAVVDRPGDLIRLAQEMESGLPPQPLRIDLLRMLDGDMPAIAAEQPQPQPQPPAPMQQTSSPSSGRFLVAADSPAADSSPSLVAAEADDRCVQCRSRTRNRVTLPCAHFLLCDRCLDSLSRCPKCNQTIIATVTAFIT